MSKFLVDSRTLLAVRDTLGRLHDQLLGVHTVVGGYEGVIGGQELEAELEQFCGHWHSGIVELGGQITGMMRRLVAAAAAYQRIENRIVAAGAVAARRERPAVTPRSARGRPRGWWRQWRLEPEWCGTLRRTRRPARPHADRGAR